jgi:hypothetical protein
MTICKTYSPDPDRPMLEEPMLEEIKFMIYVKGYISKINMTKRQILSDYESKLSQGDPLTYDNIVNCFMSLDTLIRYEDGLIINLLTETMKRSLTFGEILETTEHILSSYQEKYTGTFTKEPGKNIGVWSDTQSSRFKSSRELEIMRKITRNPKRFSYQLILEELANELPETLGVKLSLLALQTHTSAISAVSPDSNDLPHKDPHKKSQKGGTIYSFNFDLLSTSNDDDFDDYLDDIPLFGGSKIIFVKSIKKSIRVKTRRRKQQKQKSRKLRKQKSKKHKFL